MLVDYWLCKSHAGKILCSKFFMDEQKKKVKKTERILQVGRGGLSILPLSHIPKKLPWDTLQILGCPHYYSLLLHFSLVIRNVWITYRKELHPTINTPQRTSQGWDEINCFLIQNLIHH